MRSCCTTSAGCRVIVDSSALVAILRDEPDAALYTAAIENAPECRISAATFLETAILIDGTRDPIASRRLDDLLLAANITIEPLTDQQAHIARQAYRDYGRGSGHPARLNFCDCFSYALARATGEPLLFKGDDFRHTDIAPAIG
jgi:ribonuclease VapC